MISETEVPLLDSATKDLKRGGILNLNPSIYVILPAGLYFAFIYLGIAPFMPEILLKWYQDCLPASENSTQAKCVDNFENTQKFSGIFSVLCASLSFLISPQIGRFSDYHGRKPILITNSIFSWLPILALYLTHCNSPTAYFTVTVIASVFGANETSPFALLSTYVSDCTNGKSRTVAIGLIAATSGVAMIFSPLLTRFASWLDDFQTFLLILCCFGLGGTLYIVLVVPESHVVASSATRLSLELVSPLEPLRFIDSSKLMVWISVIYFCEMFSESGVAQIGMLYLNEIYELTAKDRRIFNSYVLSSLGVTSLFSQSVIVRILVSFDFRQSTMITISQLFNTIHIFWYILLQFFGKWFYFANCINTGISFIANVGLYSYLSKNVDKNQLGFAMGTLSSVSGVAMILGPLLYSQLYSVFGKTEFREMPFAIGTLFAALACSFSHFILRRLEIQTEREKS